jgi:hypothetical protein
MKTATIEGYSRYQFYKDGTVKNIDNGKLIQPQGDAETGLKLRLTNDDGDRISWRLPKLIYAAFHGSIRPEMEIVHKDGNKLNNSIANLKEVTLNKKLEKKGIR